MNNRNLFLIVLGSPRSKHQHLQCLVRTPSWFTDSCLLAVTSHDGIFFIRTLIPFMRTPSSWPTLSKEKLHHQMPSYWKLGFQFMNFMGTKYSASSRITAKATRDQSVKILLQPWDQIGPKERSWLPLKTWSQEMNSQGESWQPHR